MKIARLHHGVVEKLENDILSGKLACGEKLPSEAELAKTLDVGRRAVREALHILQNRGLVEVRQGIRAVVCRHDLDNYLSSLTGNMARYLLSNKGKLENVLELREILELYGLRRILEAGDSTAVKKLRENLELQKTAGKSRDAKLYSETHSGYHRIIIESLKNPIILMVYEQILSLIVDRISYYSKVPKQMKRSIAEHEEIVASLEQGNAQLCLAAMKKHLSLAYENFKKAKEVEPS